MCNKRFELILPYAEQFVEVWLSVLQGTEVHSLSCVDKTRRFLVTFRGCRSGYREVNQYFAISGAK